MDFLYLQSFKMLIISYICSLIYRLLIVPYGIETKKVKAKEYQQLTLLIVPYGIETSSGLGNASWWQAFNCTLWNWNNDISYLGRRVSILLIVPYGIETEDTSSRHWRRTLLIVPYGIETTTKDDLILPYTDF